MKTKNLSENIILVEMSAQAQSAEEVKTINEKIIAGKVDCDVIIDLSAVEIITSSCISNLMILQNLLHEHGRRLILSSLRVPTRCVFVVAGLEKFFQFADDKSAALAALEHAATPG
jgi:anti-anti-sigma regulatory factor